MQAFFNFFKRLLSRLKKRSKRQAIEVNPLSKPIPDDIEAPPEVIEDEQDSPLLEYGEPPHVYQYRQPKITLYRPSELIKTECISLHNEPNASNKFYENQNRKTQAKGVSMLAPDRDLIQQKLAAEIGQRGERTSNYSALPIAAYGKQLRNLYIPLPSGKRTEIDTLNISVSGIYVLETKNYRGWIYGNEDWKNWTVSYSREKKYTFYNPIMQNATHIWALQSVLPEISPDAYFSLVIFNDASEFKRLEHHSPRTYVLKHGDLNSFFNSLLRDNMGLLTREKVNEIFHKLKPYSNVSDAVKQRHIEDVNRRRTQGQNYYH